MKEEHRIGTCTIRDFSAREPDVAGDARPVSPGSESVGAEGLRVLMMPDATAGNPYQRELARALARERIQVVFARPEGALPLRRALRAHGPVDVLHLHWTHRLVLGRTRLHTIIKAARFLAELAMARLRGVRLVWTVHNLVEHERRQPVLERLVIRAATRLYHRIIVHCTVARRMAVVSFGIPRRGWGKLTSIPHGHFIGAYPDAIGRTEARVRLGVDDGSPVFVHFGQIRGYKGVFQLLDAFERLDAPDARLVVAGRPWDAETAARLEKRARRDHRIRLFLDFVPDDHVQLYMKAADAVVLPYRNVLTSGTAMLAMSFGRSVIMPRCGCAGSMLGSGGVLYEPSDPRGLLRALTSALALDLEAMGRYCRERAEAHGWQRIAAQTARLYRRGRVAA